MTYINARFGQLVAKPATPRRPGPFSARHVSPRMEAKVGEVMLAVTRKEGHRKGAPLAKTKGSVAPFEDYAALGKRIVALLAAKPLRRAEIEKIMGRKPESLYNTMRRLAATGAVVSLAHVWYLPHQLPAHPPVKRLSLPHAAE